MRNFDQVRKKRLLNWIEIQKNIGIKEMRFYVLNATDDTIKTIKEKYSEDFIKIVIHHTSFENVCQKEIKRLEKNPNSLLFKKQYNACEKAFRLHFDLSDNLAFNTHERINTNDCFYHFKYQYEYVTNYDFDEVILPRSIKSFKGFNCNNSINNFRKFNYNLYEFADELFSSYGKFFTACLSFENVIFFPNNNFLDLFFDKLKSNQNYPKSINLKVSKDKSINFKIKSISDLKYSKTLHNHSQLYKCLKNRYEILFSNSVDELWKNGIASLINTRSGKSIFNTDNTESLNQHYSTKGSLSIIRTVPFNKGFTGHFREDISGFINNQEVPINYFLVDLEYFLFLVSINSDFILI